jgi:hypothetical protein
MKQWQILAILAVLFLVLTSREYFSAPDSRPIPPCPPGTERKSNMKDCRTLENRRGT